MPNRLSKVTTITINLRAHEIEEDGITKKSKIRKLKKKKKTRAYGESKNTLIFKFHFR